ncbi:hypothetical protein PVAG01_02227 [Phlyctema vagabunda]|uniref:Uncharacterized protein n=1 Tax=Phlyctema vagabunda TaxID=108571 RepID=A0ABR4PRB0_9HELO
MHANESSCRCARMTTTREFTILHVMDSLSDKKGWEEKVLDDAISNKWKEELLAIPGKDISQPMIDYIIEELRYRAQIFKNTGRFMVCDGGVIKSDVAVPSDLKLSLRAEVKCLEDVPERYKDYHPGSNGQVIDLVHPSLFPLIYGKSKVLTGRTITTKDCISSIGLGDVIPIIEESLGDAFSTRFQWLPCDVEFKNEGNDVEITSYINNLHPQKHQKLYKIIENIVSRSIPLWNFTLSRASIAPDDDYQRINYGTEVKCHYPEELRPAIAKDEGEDEYEERVFDWEQDNVIVEQPEPEPFLLTPDVHNCLQGEGHFYSKAGVKSLESLIDLRRDYQHRGLQVIVKLATIELTPEKPAYEGGSWHVEGQLNERICATALYYFESTNITESRLAFRQRCDTSTAEEDIAYPQNEFQFLNQVFGLDSEQPAIQEVGSVSCAEGRLVTFPNNLQHRVVPFSLADPSKTGSRKILALFLVDPNIRVISTANVPPQQKDWWAEELLKTGALGAFSRELQDQIIENVDDFPISLDEAKNLREDLMDERRTFVVNTNDHYESFSFSLCEH